MMMTFNTTYHYRHWGPSGWRGWEQHMGQYNGVQGLQSYLLVGTSCYQLKVDPPNGGLFQGPMVLKNIVLWKERGLRGGREH